MFIVYYRTHYRVIQTIYPTQNRQQALSSLIKPTSYPLCQTMHCDKENTIILGLNCQEITPSERKLSGTVNKLSKPKAFGSYSGSRNWQTPSVRLTVRPSVCPTRIGFQTAKAVRLSLESDDCPCPGDGFRRKKISKRQKTLFLANLLSFESTGFKAHYVNFKTS